MPKIKKLAFFSVFHPYRGGIAQYNAALYKALSNYCEVLPYTFSRQYPAFLFPGTSQYVPEGSPNPLLKDAPQLLDSINPLSWRKAAQSILKQKPDALLLSSWMPFFGPAMGFLAREFRQLKIPVGAVLHNITPHEPRFWDNAFNKYLLKSLDFGLVMSSGVQADFERIVPNKTVLFHPHPVYTHFGKKLNKEKARQMLGLPSDATVFLFFGLIRHYKGLDTLLRAFAGMPHHAHLLIAGEAYESLAPYENLIKTSPNAKNIHLHARYIPDEEVQTYFSAADVNVLPYKTATQSGVLSVAYHFDLPVLVTDVGGLREAVEPYQAGLVVRPAAEEDLKDALLTMLNPMDYSAAIQSFKQKYSWEALAQKILSQCALTQK